MGKLVFSISLVISGIGVGYMIQVFTKKKYLNLPIDNFRQKF